MLSFIGPVSILVWALCPKCPVPVVMRWAEGTGEAATIRQPEEHPGLLMASC